MQTFATIMALASGFALTGYHGGAANLLASSIAVNVVLAPLTAAVASRRGRSGLLWGVIGLGLGMWALAAALIFLSPRPRLTSSPPGSYPPASDAA
jgi:hypothetical protein